MHALLYLLYFGYWIVLILVLGVAIRLGGGSEKIAVVLIAVSSLLTPLARHVGNTNWHSPAWGLFVLESALLAALLLLAFYSRRFWPMTCAAFQLLCVLTHPAIALEPRALPFSYAFLQGFWAYPMLATIVGGSLQHRRTALFRPASATLH